LSPISPLKILRLAASKKLVPRRFVRYLAAAGRSAGKLKDIFSTGIAMNSAQGRRAFVLLALLISLGSVSVVFGKKPKEPATPQVGGEKGAAVPAAAGGAGSASGNGSNSAANSGSATGNKSDSTSTAPPASNLKAEELVPGLQGVYTTLSRADHDYGGHRVAAMREMEGAASLLKGKLVGRGDGDERQAISDMQIRSAQMALLSVGRSASLAKNKEVTGRINAAIQQLNLALEWEAAHPDGAAAKGAAGGNSAGSSSGSSSGAAEPNPIGGNSVELAALSRIYTLLSQGNHDYQGHRIAAMKAISKASKSLGGNLTGDGHNRENQKLSDSELTQAQDLLNEVQAAYANSANNGVKADLGDAVKQLNIALKKA